MNSTFLTITGGRLIDPRNALDKQSDIHIAGGIIAAIGAPPKNFSAQQTIDARGKIICPGLVELSARLREPGAEHKATIASESAAAIHGGFTTLCIPPDTDPVIDEPAVVELIQKRAQQVHGPHILPLGALTIKLAGQQLSEMAALKQAGCVGISNALHPLQDNRVLRRAMEYAATCGLTIHVVPMDAALTNNGVAHEGPIATRLGLPSIPANAETVAIAIYLALAADTGVSIHFGRISTAAGIAMIGAAKSRGLPVTADVTIHHLLLTETALEGFNSQAYVMPPLRGETDRHALIAALKEGVIDAICADHQPHNDDAKLNPLPSTEPGISGLDTLLGLSLAFAKQENIPLPKILGALTDAPAKILGANTGHLGVGAVADICIFDPETRTTVDTKTFRSAGCNTPFAGRELQGKTVQTIIAGQLML